MESLARRVGADLLEYRDGELVGGSVDELVELGLYETWVDPDIHQALDSGQRLGASKVTNLGDWRYVVAYRRLPECPSWEMRRTRARILRLLHSKMRAAAASRAAVPPTRISSNSRSQRASSPAGAFVSGTGRPGSIRVLSSS